MMDLNFEFELGLAADILIQETCKVKKGETIMITADTESDMHLVIATARACYVDKLAAWTGKDGR